MVYSVYGVKGDLRPKKRLVKKVNLGQIKRDKRHKRGGLRQEKLLKLCVWDGI